MEKSIINRGCPDFERLLKGKYHKFHGVIMAFHIRVSSSRWKHWSDLIFCFNLPVVIFCLILFAYQSLSAEEHEEIITTHGISTFGDLKYPPDFESFDYVNPQAPKGGNMSVWGFGTFDSLNPFIIKGNPIHISYMKIAFDTLMTQSDDEPDARYGLLAKSITYPVPNKEWAIFDLREEATFSDGSPVTADDVVFSFESLKTQGSPTYQLSFQNIETAEAISPSRVKFTFKKGSHTRDLPVIAGSIPIFSKAHFSGKNFDESSIEPILASGPYVIEKAEPGQFAVFRRNDDYWAADLPVNKGRNNFDTIKVIYYTDYTVAFEGFKGGDYDFREEYYSKLWATGYTFPEIESGKIIRETITDGKPSGAQGYWINLRREKFLDPRVREAIVLAFNFEWSNKTLFYDAYKRTDSFWENSFLQAEGLPSEEELVLLNPLRGQIPESVFTEVAYTPPQADPDKLADRKMLRKAGKLLDKAGWFLVDGFRQNESGERLEITFLSEGESSARIITPFIENLKALGIEASIYSPDPAQIQLLEKNYDFDITSRRYSFSLTPGPSMRSIFGSDSAELPGSNNISGVANPAVDKLIDALESAKTRAELNVAVKALDRVIRSLHIWVPAWYSGSHRIAYRNIYSHPDNLPPYALGEMSLWWYDQEKAQKHNQTD